jgi:hypothetical protein
LIVGKLIPHAHCHHFFFLALDPSPRVSSPCAMAASHPKMLKLSSVSESDLLALVDKHLLSSQAVIQWRSAMGKDIPTPNNNEIVVLTSFQCRFGLPTYEFFHDLLHHYQIKLIHLNPNSIL